MPVITLLLDVGTGQLKVEGNQPGGRPFHSESPQWLELYVYLWLIRLDENPADAIYVTPAMLSEFGAWQFKGLPSISSECSRHLSDLQKYGVSDVIDHRGKTKAWRLAIPLDSVTPLPSPDVVQKWAQARYRRQIDESILASLNTLVEATVNCYYGEDKQLDALQTLSLSQKDASSYALSAWRTYLLGRMAQRVDHDEIKPKDLLSDWKKAPDIAGKAVAVRLNALDALSKRFKKPQKQFESLMSLASELELSNDASSLACVLNVMGILARREGELVKASAYHLRAIGLAGICGDLGTLHASLFNLALCRSSMLKAQGQIPDKMCIDLAKLSIRIGSTFNVGNDSAQAEASIAKWALQQGDIARSLKYLSKATAIETRLSSRAENGYVSVIGGILKRVAEGKSGLADLRRARLQLEDLGDLKAVDRIKLIETFERLLPKLSEDLAKWSEKQEKDKPS